MKLRIFALLLIINLAGACDCGCDNVPRYLDVKGLSVKVTHLTKKYPTLPPVDDNLQSTQKVDYDSLGIGVIPTGTYYSKARLVPCFSLVGSAYACKCPEAGSYGTQEQISEFKITSDAAFTNSGSAGEVLNQYFEVYDFTHRELPKPLVNLDALIAKQPKFGPYGMLLRLKVRPTGSLKHKFTMHYKQTNGEAYSVTTQEILFD